MAPKNEEYITQALNALIALSLESKPFSSRDFHKTMVHWGFEGGETASGDSLRALKRWAEFGLISERGIYRCLPCWQWNCLPNKEWLVHAYNNCKDPKRYPDGPGIDISSAELADLKVELSKVCTQECAASWLGITNSQLNTMLRGKKPLAVSTFYSIKSLINHLNSLFKRS